MKVLSGLSQDSVKSQMASTTTLKASGPVLSDEDEFDDVEDDDLLLAESANLTTTTSGTKRSASFDSEHDRQSKKIKYSNDTASVQLAQNILQQTWDFTQFKLMQQQAIARLIEGGSAVVVFPTGGGKSLVYQVQHTYVNDDLTAC